MQLLTFSTRGLHLVLVAICLTVVRAQAQTQPDLLTTAAFIVTKLPTQWSWIVSGHGTLWNAEWTMKGCLLSGRVGSWSQRLYADTTSPLSGPYYSVYSLVIEPRAGQRFEHRSMTSSERRVFLSTRHSLEPAALFRGYIETLDFAKVRLAGIQIQNTQEPMAFATDDAEVDPDRATVTFLASDAPAAYDEASRLQRAFTNAARLCGATDDQF